LFSSLPDNAFTRFGIALLHDERLAAVKSLDRFRCCDATCRFSMAAKELCVTPGAVRQQIQKLEQ
jgi:hypothetical protein